MATDIPTGTSGLVTGTRGDDTFVLDPFKLTGPLTIDGGEGRDRVTFPSGSNEMRVQLRVNLATGEIRTVDKDGQVRHFQVTFTGIEDLYASKGTEPTFIGDDGANVLYEGLGYRGTFVGGGGNDTLQGDTADYSSTAGPVTASLRDKRAQSVDGIDTLNVTNLIGSAFDDWLVGDNSPNTLEGGLGDDTLDGGDDFGPHDVASYAHATGPVTVSLASGRASGAAGNDTLLGISTVIGSAYGDRLTGGPDGFVVLLGGAGDDTLEGGGADDWLSGGPGDDLLVGGDGVDTADYYGAAAGITASLIVGTAQGGGIGSDTLVGIERLGGSSFADMLEGSAADDTIYGGGGADTIYGGAGNDELQYGAVLNGGDGDDRLMRGQELYGGKGNDVLMIDTSNLAALTLDGGSGFDVVRLEHDVAAVDLGYTRPVTINLATGEITYSYGVQKVVFHSVEALYDSKGWDTTLIGDDGPNVLQGDVAMGGGGNDTFLTRAGPDQSMDGGSGTDTFRLGNARAAYSLQLSSNGDMAIAYGSFSVGTTTSVERLVFADQALALGDRALDVARIAFALWSKDIVSSAALFGKGIDWYDQGRSFDEAVRYALGFFAAKSDAQIAEQLLRNVPHAGAARTADELVSLMNSHGGGIDGRAYVTALIANDVMNVAQVQAAGIHTNGITCALSWGAESLFLMPG